MHSDDHIRRCCMLWKQLQDESTVISLSCDSLLERATQLDQSFCAFSVPLIHFNRREHLQTLTSCILGGGGVPRIFRVNSLLFFNTQQDLSTGGMCSEIIVMYIFFFQLRFYTA